MKLYQFEDNECVLTTQRHCPCIEFILPENQRLGFQASQLLHYQLEANDSASNGFPQGAPEVLTIAFATSDVTLTGWRLDRIADHLRDGDLLAVRTLPERYADLDRTKTRVAKITVTPITKG